MKSHKPRVWNISNTSKPHDAVYCGRGTPWGNPYKLGIHGNRDAVCDKFEQYILPTLDVSSLKGKDLVCHCKPKRCHADAIFRKANHEL
jgi:hypothetical protein